MWLAARGRNWGRTLTTVDRDTTPASDPRTSKRNKLLIGHSWRAGCWHWMWGQINALAPHIAPMCALLVATATGDITTSVNNGKKAGPMSSLLLLDVYAADLIRVQVDDGAGHGHKDGQDEDDGGCGGLHCRSKWGTLTLRSRPESFYTLLFLFSELRSSKQMLLRSKMFYYYALTPETTK